MFRRWLLAFLILLPCWIGVMAQETVPVVILPFEVHAPEGVDALKGQIRSLLTSQLKAEGIAVVEPPLSHEPLPSGAEEMRLEHLRSLGVSVGADFVIWGSLTQMGKRHSLDAKIVKTHGEALPETFYVEGEGIGAEHLLASVQGLGRDISMKIYKAEKVAEVLITGSKRIEAEAIKKNVKTKKGEAYSDKRIRNDVKSIYKMGYFADVRVEATGTPDGKVVTFHVAEKETVRNIRVKGNKKFDDE